jgi:hypothetical protein
MWTADNKKLVVRVKKINTQNYTVNYAAAMRDHPPQ